MLKIVHLYIYPIKSLAGIEVNEAQATETGFEYDRQWMLTDENGGFLTQREIPGLALFKTAITDGNIVVRNGSELFSFGVSEKTDTRVKTHVFEDPADTVVVSDKADQWFSAQLNRTVRLVSIIARKHLSKKTNTLIPVSLADGYPYLLLGTASLDYLNRKITPPVSLNRFRPNIVVKSQLPHQEDDWGTMVIGTAGFENVKPCGRCRIITIDQATAETGKEPLTTLSTYRRAGNSVNFGVNLICTRPGKVSTGDLLMI